MAAAAQIPTAACAPSRPGPHHRHNKLVHRGVQSSPVTQSSRRRRGSATQLRAFDTSLRNSAQLVTFPKDYAQLVSQAQKALQAALDDGVPLMEIQFPPGGLEGVPGDVEGNTENNLTVRHLRGICAQFERNKTAKTTRVFFPDPVEQSLALTGAAPSPDGVRPPQNAQTLAMFADFPGHTDYLEEPDFLSVSGLDKLLNKRVTLDRRVVATDTGFVVAYPSLNTAELTRTKELYDGERNASGGGRPVVVCNGELERTRSNYYPPFWNATEMGPLRGFAKEFEGIYFIHNFKGSNPAVLFRSYPGPWQVIRRRRGTNTMEVVHTQADYPGIQKVALEILPKHL